MKRLAKLNGAKTLNKIEQKEINGGKLAYKKCMRHSDCPPGYCCNNHITGRCEEARNCR